MQKMDLKAEKLNFLTTTRFLMQFIDEFKLQYVLFYIGWLFHTIVLIVSPIIFGIMINQVVYYQDIKLFISLGMVFLYVTVFGVILYYLIYEMYAYLWNAVNRQLRLKLFRTLQNLSLTEYNKLKHGETVNMIEFWSVQGVNFLIRNIIHFFNNIFFIVVCLGIILLINWKFALITVVLVPFSVVISYFTGRKVRSNSDKNKEENANYFSWLFEVFHGFTEIRLLGVEKRIKQQFESKQTKINDINAQIAMDNLIAKEGLVNIKNIILLLQYALLAYLAVKNDMSIGIITVLLTFFHLLSDKLTQVVETCMDAQQRISIIQHMKDFLEKETYCKNIEEKMEMQDKVESIQFQNCCFSYGDEMILKDINLTINAGEKIAIVGSSGSGKSTLLNLLLGFHEPTGGNVFVNGKNMKDIKIDSFYKRVSVVFQNVLLFKGNIKNNILMGNGASEKEMVDACINASIYDEISSLDKGFEADVAEAASNFSGGQRQRIGIARAYVKDADMVIFDEATSALDTENEYKIIQAWNRILKNKIGVIVSHRLDVVMSCDSIIMLKEGTILAKGTPLEMAENGDFRALFAIAEGDNS